MFKLPDLPTPKANQTDLADYVETECLRNGCVSLREVNSALARLEENDYSGGVPEEDNIDHSIEEAFLEIDNRRKNCNGGYPFTLSEAGHVLRIDETSDYSRGWLYLFLLMSTRLRMDKEKYQSGIDGTLLFEEISSHVAKKYWGERAESFIFGTASDISGFEDRVNALCQEIKEGAQFCNRDSGKLSAKDDKLDVVVYKHFTDQFYSKLIGFGQCKTGTRWKDELTIIQPDKFCAKWMHSQPVVIPVRMFFLSESLSRSLWYGRCSEMGLLFDRCRMIDYGQSIPGEIIERTKKWTSHALSSKGYVTDPIKTG